MIVSNEFANFVLEFIIAAFALIFSIVLHELAHGYTALRSGDNTAKLAGRLSINPMRHFDFWGLAMLLFVRFGYAKPIPINPNNFKNRRIGLFAVSIAGVTVNIILSFIFSFFYVLMASREWNNAGLSCLEFLFYCLAMYNLFLCFFNLLPLFPLDGYNLMESLFGFRNSIVKFSRNYGNFILLALFGLYILAANGAVPEWMNVLGLYLKATANNIYQLFLWLWKLVLGIA